MKNLFSLKFTRHDMLRTKCFNFYLILFNKRFQLGLYQEFLSSLSGKYVGLKVCIHTPINPFRINFFIPSIYMLNLVFIKKWSYEYLKRN